MAIRKFSTASISAGTNKSTKLWDQETFQSGMFALATINLSTSTSSVTFSGIPSNYTHLQLSINARSASTGGSMRLEFNSDTSGSNYARQLFMGDGASASASAANADAVTAAIGDFPVSSSAASVYGAYTIDILDAFSTTKRKTLRSFSGYDLNGSGYIQFRSCLWTSQSAITSIRIYEGSGSSFAADSSFMLYGIKAA